MKDISHLLIAFSLCIGHSLSAAIPTSSSLMVPSPVRDSAAKTPDTKAADAGHRASFCKQRPKNLTEINSPEDLKKVRSGGSYILGKTFELPYGFLPIGTQGETIKNIYFNGNGHAIRALGQPLFSSIESSTLENIHLFDIYIGVDTGSTGALAKEVGSNSCFINVRVTDGWIQSNTSLGGVFGKIEGNNFHLDTVFSSLSIKARGGIGENFGGIIGSLELTKAGTAYLTRLNGKGTITAPDGEHVGGLIGQVKAENQAAKLILNHSRFTGVVKGTRQVGGLIGSITASHQNPNILLEANYTQAHVTGKSWEDPSIAQYSNLSSYVGGLIGNLEVGHIRNSYTQGFVSGRMNVGGFVGGTDKGNCSQCSISNTYTAAQVVVEPLSYYPNEPSLQSKNVGAFVGKSVSYVVKNSFWDNDVSKVKTSAAGTGKSTQELKAPKTFSDWNLGQVWELSEDKDYPKISLIENPNLKTN